MADPTEKSTTHHSWANDNSFNYTRIQFLEKMFDIILDNVIAPKYKFKLYNLGSYTKMSFDEIKKLRNMSKYQVSEMLKEKRITRMDEFISKFEPNVKQYNFLSIYCKSQYEEVYNKILKATKLINEGRNIIIEALTQLDSINYLTGVLEIFTSEQMKEAAKFFVDNKLGFDFTPFQMWKYKKRVKDIKFEYDPKLVTSKRKTVTSDPKEYITYSAKIIYHEWIE